jgi:short-subunit dehydrogenase
LRAYRTFSGHFSAHGYRGYDPKVQQTALVTGASSGIGAFLAKQLAERGHHVILVARSADKLADLAAEIGDRSTVLPADLSNREGRAELPDRIAALGKQVDILVNNAGLSTMGRVANADPKAELNVIEVDVAAVVELCTRFVPGMVERGQGAVLNVASVAGFGPLPGQAVYGAAKAFVLSYTQALRQELRDTGVKVTALCPGPVHTDFGQTAGFTPEEESVLPEVLWVSAEDVARAGIEGLDSDKGVVVPGKLNQAITALYQHIPRQLLLPVLAKNHPGLKK